MPPETPPDQPPAFPPTVFPFPISLEAEDIPGYTGPKVHPVQRGVFERLRDLVVDKSQAATFYFQLDESLNGTLINADAFRDLSPEYRDGRLSDGDAATVLRDIPDAMVHDRRWVRTWLTSATTGPAAAASRYWAEREAGLNTVSSNSLLVAFGGSGSGKTRAVEDLPTVRRLFDLVYDSTLTDSSHACRIAERFPDGNGLTALCFLFVLTDFGTAVRRMIKRAVEDGRYIPIGGMVENHRKSRETLVKLLRRYGVRTRIQIIVVRTVENSGPEPVDVVGMPEDALLLPENAKDIAYATLDSCRVGIPDDLYRRLAR